VETCCERHHPIKEIGFRAWLRTQKERDDPVGDFAYDVTRDTRARLAQSRLDGKKRALFPAHPSHWMAVLVYLSRYTIADEVVKQVSLEAWREYKMWRTSRCKRCG
jgi:hypothetical protein